jgi:hypothetical protein
MKKVTFSGMASAAVFLTTGSIAGGYLVLVFVVPILYFVPISTARVSAVAVTEEERATWKSYSNPREGIFFRYPSFLTEQNPRYSVSYIGYAARIHFEDGTDPGSFYLYQSIPAGSSDKLILSFKEGPLTKSNLLQRDLFSPMFQKDFAEVTIDGRKGYRYYYHDEERVAEHFAFPSSAGSGIIQLSFLTYKDGNRILLPYRDAILSSVRFE